MTRFKSGLAFLMALVMVLTLSVPTFAQGATNSFVIEANGVKYQVDEYFDTNGNKVVTVNGGNEINTAINDGDSLHIATQDLESNITKNTSIAITKAQPNTASPKRVTDSLSSLWWNYSYYYSDDNLNTYGMFFSLSSGDTYGSWAGFDHDNMEARKLAYEFCSDVRNLDSAQWAASAASGVFAASIATAIGSAAPTAGIGTIISIIVAIGSGGVGVAEWIIAVNNSRTCNQRFLQFTQSL